MTRGPGEPESRAGFTLVELLIVILILAIMAAVVIPSIGTATDAQVTSAARTLACDLENARSLALTTQHSYTLLFSDDVQSYKVAADYAGTAYGATVAVGHPVLANELYEVRPAALTGMADVTVQEVTFGPAPYLTYVTFTAEGAASESGAIVLKAGESYMRVSVEQLTGVVTVDTWHR